MDLFPKSSKSKIRLHKKLKMNEKMPKNKKFSLIYENEFIALINSLSSSIKEYYLIIINIINELKNNAIELNKFILTSKCLINEMNNKTNFQEKSKQFEKNIEGISLSNKVINNNIIFFEKNLSKFFNDSKTIFKKMKEFKKNQTKNILDSNTDSMNNFNNNTNKSNNPLLLERKNININPYNNKPHYLKLSLETNKICSNQNKPNSISCSNRKYWYTKNIKDYTINLSQNNYKDGRNNLNLSDSNYLEKKVRNKNNKNKMIIHGKSNSLGNIQYNINKIITDKSISQINKGGSIIDTSPKKRRMSLSNVPIDINYPSSNYNNCNRIKYPNSAQTTSRRKNDEHYSSILNYNYINIAIFIFKIPFFKK